MSAPRTPRALAFVASLTLVAPSLPAQSQHVALPVGTRVRVAAPPRSDWAVGKVVLADSERIILRSGRSAVPDTIPLAAVQALEVSRGRPRALRAASGMLLGGLGLAAAAGLITHAEVGGQAEAGLAIGVTAAGGFIVGSIAGGIVGALTAPERWEYVPIR